MNKLKNVTPFDYSISDHSDIIEELQVEINNKKYFIYCAYSISEYKKDPFYFDFDIDSISVYEDSDSLSETNILDVSNSPQEYKRLIVNSIREEIRTTQDWHQYDISLKESIHELLMDMQRENLN